jgi:hypothetical protein
VVKHCLAVFDLIFLRDPSFKSTFAQNKSCSSYRPLQLLFWPNFMFQCKIWSFGRSKSAKITQIRLLCPVWSVPRRPRRWGRHASRRRTSPIVHTLPSLSAQSRAHFRLSFPFLAPRAEPTNPSPAARRRRSCAGRPPPSRRHFLAPRPPSTLLALPSTHAVPFPSSFEPTLGRISACAASAMAAPC